MAGNTKLLGFGAGHVLLERWGTSTRCPLPDEALESIKNSCFKDLPLHAPESKGSYYLDGHMVSTNHQTGTVDVFLNSSLAKYLVSALEDYLEDRWACPGKEDSHLDTLRSALKRSVAEIENYRNEKGEPGLEED